jgi:hypothetical protein
MQAMKRILVAGMMAALLVVPLGLVAPAAHAARTLSEGVGETPAPMEPTTGTAERLSGHAWGTGPGQATADECQGYADAINGITEQEGKKLVEGTPGDPQTGPVSQGLYDAGKARGCTFLAD